MIEKGVLWNEDKAVREFSGWANTDGCFLRLGGCPTATLPYRHTVSPNILLKLIPLSPFSFPLSHRIFTSSHFHGFTHPPLASVSSKERRLPTPCTSGSSLTPTCPEIDSTRTVDVVHKFKLIIPFVKRLSQHISQVSSRITNTSPGPAYPLTRPNNLRRTLSICPRVNLSRADSLQTLLRYQLAIVNFGSATRAGHSDLLDTENR
jgi:hypothetical protein